MEAKGRSGGKSVAQEKLAKKQGWRYNTNFPFGDNWVKDTPPNGRLNVIVSIDDGDWHLSISHTLTSPIKIPGRYPTYEEIKQARYLFCPDDVTMAMLFPPSNEFVNIHNTTFHLWQIPSDIVQ